MVKTQLVWYGKIFFFKSIKNTLSLIFSKVIERERSQDEKDGLRYYMDGTVEPLWEEWFYCYDLGVQLGPVIKRY